MELIALLFALYAGQCCVFLPVASVLFAGRLRGASAPGPGWRLAHPLPSGSSLVGERPPLLESRDGIVGRGVAGLFGAGLVRPAPRIDPDEAAASEVRGRWLRLDGVRFLRAASESGAQRVATLLESALGGGVAALREALEQLLAEELSLGRVREAREQVAAATRWLRALLDVYALALFALVPAAAGWIGVEAALLRAAPVLLVLHASCLVALALAHRKLRAGDLATRVQTLAEAALYPPSLLRSFQWLEAEILGRVHPATLAALLLGPEARADFLRRELVRARHAAARQEAGSLADLERQALEGLVRECGESATTLLAEPARRDPRARAWCPACHAEYRRAQGRCTECALPLTPFGSP